LFVRFAAARLRGVRPGLVPAAPSVVCRASEPSEPVEPVTSVDPFEPFGSVEPFDSLEPFEVGVVSLDAIRQPPVRCGVTTRSAGAADTALVRFAVVHRVCGGRKSSRYTRKRFALGAAP
jgi:hypothetical protein